MPEHEFLTKLRLAIPAWAKPRKGSVHRHIVPTGDPERPWALHIISLKDPIMSKKQDRIVSRRPDGKWENRRNDGKKATSIHSTQQEARAAAKANLQNQGGGELTVKGKDGKIRAKDTIKPGNDPYPPKG